MFAFSEAVLSLVFICGLPSCTFSTGTANRKLPENFIGIFRNDDEKGNFRSLLSAVIEWLPRARPVGREGSFFSIVQQETDNDYSYSLRFDRREIAFELGESRILHYGMDWLKVEFDLTEDRTILKGSIDSAQKGNLQLQFTASLKGVQLVDSARTTQETLDKANSIFRPINHGGSFSFSVDTKLWIREFREGRFLRATLFSAAYQWFSGFSLFENDTFYHNLFNGTAEGRCVLEKSTLKESVLLTQIVSVDGKFNLTARTAFERDAVKESIMFNGEQVTLYYRRIVEDFLYGSYEEVTVPGEERMSAFWRMGCPETISGARVTIGRNVDKMYSLDITPCEGADPLHIPFMLNNSTYFASTQQNNVTAEDGFQRFLHSYNILLGQCSTTGRLPTRQSARDHDKDI